MPDRAAISLKFEGMEQIRDVVRKLPGEVRTKVMSLAMKRAAVPLVEAAKLFAPRKTGALRESIGAVVRKDRNGSAYVAVGPERGRFSAGRKLGKKDDRAGSDQPSRYAHLVEFGHHAVAPRAGTTRRKGTATPAGFVPARPFMRPALLASHDAVGTELAAGVSDGISHALDRLVKGKNPRR